VKVTVTLEIDYNTDRYSDEVTARDEAGWILSESIKRLIGMGGLSGDSNLEVIGVEMKLSGGS
jgi:uncharacterized phosphosugar-binding protein